MLIDILRMPPVFGIPIDRRQTITTNSSFLSTDARTVAWRGVPIHRDRLNVGTAIDKHPKQLYKAIHISDDSTTAFETVFASEEEGAVCLYTKIINGSGTRVGISLNAIQYYQAFNNHLFPLSHFLISNRLPGVNSVINTPLIRTNPVENIVPPIFDLNILQNIFQMAIEKGPEAVDSRMAAAYYPLHQHLPQVLEALLLGRFNLSPFMEFAEQHPIITIPHDKWFSWERVSYALEARGLNVHLNHEAFDHQVLNIMYLFPTRFQITSLMSHALDGIHDVWLTSFFDDTYTSLTGRVFADQREAFIHVLFECAKIYCKLFQIDASMFLNTSMDKSSITIGKNIYDEIEIIFHDLIHDRYICFYSSFPALALSTLAVGWYN